MQIDSQISLDPRRQWFTLEDLTASLLADAVTADAQFQLLQSRAWNDFGRMLEHSGALASVDSVDLAQGYGRHGNLGLSRLEMTLDLEPYRPSAWRRCCAWLASAFGVEQPASQARYRLAGPGGGNVHVRLCAERREGRWQVASKPTVTQEVA